MRAEYREHRLAQRRQRRQHSDHKHVQRQRQNTIITLQMEPMKRGKTDCRRFKKRLQITVKLSSSMHHRQQQLHDLHHAHQEYSNGLTTAYQPLHHEQHWVLSSILQ